MSWTGTEKKGKAGGGGGNKTPPPLPLAGSGGTRLFFSFPGFFPCFLSRCVISRYNPSRTASPGARESGKRECGRLSATESRAKFRNSPEEEKEKERKNPNSFYVALPTLVDAASNSLSSLLFFFSLSFFFFFSLFPTTKNPKRLPLPPSLAPTPEPAVSGKRKSSHAPRSRLKDKARPAFFFSAAFLRGRAGPCPPLALPLCLRRSPPLSSGRRGLLFVACFLLRAHHRAGQYAERQDSIKKGDDDRSLFPRVEAAAAGAKNTPGRGKEKKMPLRFPR